MLEIFTRALCADDDVRQLLGFHVLGRLGPAEQERTSRHLSECRECARESADLRGVTVLLDLLSAADVAEIITAGAAGETVLSRPRNNGPVSLPGMA